MTYASFKITFANNKPVKGRWLATGSDPRQLGQEAKESVSGPNEGYLVVKKTRSSIDVIETNIKSPSILFWLQADLFSRIKG